MASRSLFSALVVVGVVVVGAESFNVVRADDAAQFDAAEIEFFEREIRPLLVEHCHDCHGAEDFEAGLRLTDRSSLLAGGDSGPAIVPGQPAESLLIEAIRYGPDSYQMPPDGKLPPEAIAALERWVERGAAWPGEMPASESAAASTTETDGDSDYWAFGPLASIVVPKVNDADWPGATIDYFILERLEAAGLTPAAPADRRTLIRRVTYDLIGLPPTPEEVAAFIDDNSDDAFAKVVDRLLDSPHYGERWGRHWLDLVRYAETYGHEFDYDIPGAFHYRDYVIRAFNADVPYDQFLIEHLAGDMLASPRRHPEEGFNESILATGFLHLGEAKHSPVDIRGDEAERIDNQIDVLSKTFLGMTVACARCHDHKFDPISAKDYYALAGFLQSSRYQQAFIDDPAPNLAVIQRIQQLLNERTELTRELELATTSSRQPTLQAPQSNVQSALPAMSPEQVLYAAFDGPDFESWHATGLAFGDEPVAAWEVAASGRALDGLRGGAAADSGRYAPQLSGVLRSPTFTVEHPRIWYRVAGQGTINAVVDSHRLIYGPLHGSLRLAIEQPHEFAWVSQDVTDYQGHKAYIEIIDDHRDAAILVDAIVFGGDEPPTEAPQPSSNDLSATTERDDAQSPVHATSRDSAILADLQAKLDAIDRQIETLRAQLKPSRRAPAMADGTPEDEHVHIRGSHRRLGDVVPRRLLTVLAGRSQEPLQDDCGRLALAHRMLTAARPLVARVIVNRIWHHHFGSGIVATCDNFGELGEPPSHPELLDYLAGRFIKEGWSLKALHRQLLISSTYRMSSRADAAAEQRDPTNRLLHRMPIRRLEAEAIRDGLLAVSGELGDAMFGPSVAPYLTPFMSGRGRPEKSGPLDGDGRRSVYISVRRNFLTPLLLAFDYPEPFSTMGRRGATNVPAQALILLNDPLVHALSEAWARRIVDGTASDTNERIRQMYERAFARLPTEVEQAAAAEFIEQRLVNSGRDELRAWAELCHVTFNLKEFIFIR